MTGFKSCYTWPAPHFPFRLYYDSPKIRIFLIVNIFHNYNWLSRYSRGIRGTDLFIVRLGWHHRDWHAKHSLECIQNAGLDQSRFHILFNDHEDEAIFRDYGFKGTLVNQNCFLDEKLYTVRNNIKLYDAIYVARLVEFKRHYLASSIRSLALVQGDKHGSSPLDDAPSSSYINENPLTAEEVAVKISESRVGLCLSETEGACFSSSEYLLSGIPVVSTQGYGGRMLWYNSYNSKIADSCPESVAEMTKRMIDEDPNPERIRAMHLHMSTIHRKNFIELLQNELDSAKACVDAEGYYKSNYFNKMIKSEKPDFDQLFPV